MTDYASPPGGNGNARLGLTLVGRFEDGVVEGSTATVKVKAPPAPVGGGGPWQYIAVARVPTFDVSKQTEEKLTVEGEAAHTGLCDPCKVQKLQIKQDLERARTGLAMYQKLTVDLEKKIKEAEAKKAEAEGRVLPKIGDMWKVVQEAGSRTWTFLGSVVNIVVDFFGGSGGFGLNSDTKKKAEEDLAAVQKAKAKVDLMLKKIEDVRKHCPHFDPTLGNALGELLQIKDIIKSMKLTNLVPKGEQLANAINSASNVEQAAQMLNGEPCQQCVQQAQAIIDAYTKERDGAKQQAEQFSNEAKQLQAKLDAFPKDCEHNKPGQAA
jgi:hypothetical protein